MSVWTLNLGDITSTVSVSVNGSEQLTDVVFCKGYTSEVVEHTLGTVTLTRGTNVIRITRTDTNSKGAYITKMKLDADQLAGGTLEAEICEGTITGNNAGCYPGATSVGLAYSGTYFEYTLSTKTTQDYVMSVWTLNLGDITSTVSVSVNGSEQLTDVVFCKGYTSEVVKHTLGTVTLTRGTNVIRITRTDTNSKGAYITKMKLEADQSGEDTPDDDITENITGGTLETEICEGTITGNNAGCYPNATSVGLAYSGTYFEYTLSTKTTQNYVMSVWTLNLSDITSTVSVSVNGSEQLTDVVFCKGYTSEVVEHTLGTVTLTRGTNVIRITRTDPNSKGTYITKMKLEADKDSYLIEVNKSLSTTASAEVTYNASQSGWYGITANVSQANTFALKVSSGKQSITKAIFADGKIYIGKLYLKEGDNTIVLTANNGSATLSMITVGKMQEEIDGAQANIAVTPKTVGYMTGYSDNDTDCSASDSLNLRVGSTDDKSFTIGIYTDKALDYTFSPTYIAKYEAMSMNVTVNGEKVISGAALTTSSSKRTSNVGTIHLNRGLNEITLDADGKDGEELTISNIRLDAVNSFASGEFTKALTEGNAAEVYFNTDGTSGYSDDYATFNPISWVEYDVYTPAERVVTLRLNAAATTETTYSVSLNGVQNYVETLAAISSSASEFKNATSQIQITLPAGHSTIRYTQKSGTANIKSITVQNYETNEIKVKTFELQDEYGYMAPKVVTEGLDIYAVAELQKLGAEIADKVSLVVAQYTGDGEYNKLEKCVVETIDFSDVGVYDIKTCKLKFKLEGEGGTVKAFLVKDDSIEPLAEQIGYTEIKLVSDEILNEPAPEYCIAEELTNSSGVNYGSYHHTNAKGTVQAIFYDSVIPTTGQQKVFAYMGIPTTDANGNPVSENNPVPAVVVLHGGQGKAEYTWVQNWMNKGYAAIALDLYGDGPDDTAHPYKGIHPWGATIFKGIETSGMYQNVVNIIRAHTLIMSMPGVDETKTALTGLSMGGMTTANAIGIDTRFDAGVPIYGTRSPDKQTYIQNGYNLNWDASIQLAKANVPVMILMGDEDTNFTVKATSSSYTVLKDGYFSIYHQLPHSQVAQSFGQVYDFIENVFNGNNTYVKISNEVVENGTLTADCSVPAGTTIKSVETYYMTGETNPTAANEYEWGKITDYTLSGRVLKVENIPADATYCYTSVHFVHDYFESFNSADYNKDLIISTKLVEVK